MCETDVEVWWRWWRSGMGMWFGFGRWERLDLLVVFLQVF